MKKEVLTFYKFEQTVEYMKDAPSYFDNVYEDEWLEDPFVKEMIEDVDSSKVINAHIIESPVLGAITPKELSKDCFCLRLTEKCRFMHKALIFLMIGVTFVPWRYVVDKRISVCV